MADRARKLAAECLVRCEAGGYSNLMLRRALEKSDLSRQDRSFCTALLLGTLSRLRTLDAVLQPFLKKPIRKLDAEVRAVLRLGCFQLHYMDGVPQHAAVNESAELCRAFKKSSAAGLVNAVLRRASLVDVQALCREIADPVLGLAVRCSVDDALAARFLSLYGADAERRLSCFFQPAAVYARCNTLRLTERQLAKKLAFEGITVQETALPGCLLLAEGFAGRSGALQSGEMHIQSLPAQLAASAVGASAGERILDLCAAPGGKTLCIAQDMKNSGELVACELHRHRLALLEQQSALEGVTILKPILGDARELGGGPFHRILCDVPCSGYGELAAKPELRYRAPRQDGALPKLQLEILCHAWELLAPGGRLVYSTCTLLPEENEQVVARFLQQTADAALAPFENFGVGSWLREGELRVDPTQQLPEGFYIACFHKMC